jgi:pyridoxamine 5'-phosphate oxidase
MGAFCLRTSLGVMGDPADLRREYADAGLHESDVPDEPRPLFDRWFAEASDAGLYEPNAMVVASVSAEGAPSSRMVLLKGVTAEGWTFFTNLESRKGSELLANPACALLFPWHPLKRQVRIEGTATPLDRPAVDAYFARRPRGSQLGAWASPQSRPVDGREALDARYDEVTARFADEEDVPAPPHWGGFLVTADVVEFWQGRPGRMHDRIVYTRTPDGWSIGRLAP